MNANIIDLALPAVEYKIVKLRELIKQEIIFSSEFEQNKACLKVKYESNK